MPQLLVQVSQADQLLTLQFTGQWFSLQALFSDREPHGAPPCAAGASTARLLLALPPPQFAVQALQLPQAVSVQSNGQGCVEHGRPSAVSGHTYPPCAACVSMLRERLCMPTPQLFVHVDQLVQLDTSQWIGQRPSEHACSCVSAPQPLPP